ncbi:MAG: Ig-like domain-containing protein [Deltaproteobacteria bacterium]|nr:Ig-like domain-containing protein [Deltaproteobacteria bacterium]
MNKDKECSRREFLRKFAMLSSASILLGVSTGCGSGSSGSQNMNAVYGPSPVPLYGPAPVSPVSGMFFLDSKSAKVNLGNNQSVPIHTSFTIGFYVDFSTSTPATITFTDANGTAVANTQSWADSHTLVVTPSADLLNDTLYTLRINDVTLTNGVKYDLSPFATTTFKTVHNVTIAQGVWGTVRFWEGDFMPVIPSGTITPVVREIFIHKVTTANVSGTGPFFASVPTELVAKVSSDATGFYQAELAVGTYSVFVKEGASFYANILGGQGQIQPVEVLSNTVTELQIDITYKASF